MTQGEERVRAQATLRAYAGDVRAVLVWCAEHGIQPDLGQMDASRVFSYCVSMARQGRSVATIRRRLTALRAAKAVGGHACAATVIELFEIEKRILRNHSGQTGVLVLSDDPIVRAGLSVVLSDTGALCWTNGVAALDPGTMTAWSYVLVWIESPVGLDRFGAIRHFDSLGMDLTTSVPLIAIHTAPLHSLVRLRLAEAGFRYALPHEWLSIHLERLSALLIAAELPQEFHLETAFALRQLLGLNLSGALAPFLDAAEKFEREVWTLTQPAERLPLSRHNVRRLRRLAHELAGMPAPEFGRYSTSVRRAPQWPEWSAVRELVRASLGIGISL